MEKKPKLEITELFMAKAGLKGWGRCFHGIIKREKDADGNPILFSKINMHEGYHFDNIEKEWVREKKPDITGFIYAADCDQWKLGENLDDIVLLVLDYGIHKDAGVTSTIAESPFFHN